MNDWVNPSQAKIFINAKGQNQDIRMILRITISENLPRDKKRGVVFSPFQGEVYSAPPRGGVLISATRGGGGMFNQNSVLLSDQALFQASSALNRDSRMKSMVIIDKLYIC